MTIDERLEKLAERHQAMAQHLELQISFWDDSFKEMKNQLAEQKAEWNERFAKMDERSAAVDAQIAALVNHAVAANAHAGTVDAQIAALVSHAVTVSEQIERMSHNIARVSNDIEALTGIAKMHEHRIDSLERGTAA